LQFHDKSFDIFCVWYNSLVKLDGGGLGNLLFNSYVFILMFFPIVFVGYFILLKLNLKSVAKGFLVLASLYFYGYWNVAYLPIILVSILVNFLIAYVINKENRSKKAILIAGIIFNCGLLGYYKYSDFFLENVNTVLQTNFPLLQLALPLAISFFTFQQVAYLVDTYRGETKGYSFLDYIFFVTFFPQLIAGPIVHHSEIITQLQEPGKYKMNSANISKGLYIFAIGLFKKVIIADTFAIWATNGYNNVESLTLIDSWIATMSYTFQLYFDFSGYCDMAIGLALFFNLKLPMNFNSPYKAVNIQDFWRRWHITLNRFFTQYVYFPLGGSRVGKVRTYFNIFIIFFISGFWHGAGWTFIIWGTMHGLASIVYRAWSQLGLKLPKVIAWFITFLFVHLAWVYFRSPDVATAHTMISKMFNFTELQVPHRLAAIIENAGLSLQPATLFFDLKLVLVILVFLGVVVFMKNSIEKLNTFSLTVRNAAIISLVTVLSLLYLNRISEFLYFNF
jgi:alginate O-acetyltransferase complex protein AlgI